MAETWDLEARLNALEKLEPRIEAVERLTARLAEAERRRNAAEDAIERIRDALNGDLCAVGGPAATVRDVIVDAIEDRP